MKAMEKMFMEQYEKKVMFTVRLENWSTGYSREDPYCPPEVARLALKGNIYDHPRFDQGCFVKTAPIIDAKGKLVTVEGGSFDDHEYYQIILGEIDPEFRKWLAEHRPNWNPEEPITFPDRQQNKEKDNASTLGKT